MHAVNAGDPLKAEPRPSIASDAGSLELRQFKPTHEALGILVDYLAKAPPFRDFTVGELVIALKHQLARGHHVCAFRGELLVGYCGWLNTNSDIGERWMDGKGELKPVADNADAAALTIVRSDAADALTPMIRAIRGMNKGKRIFFRRDYSEGGKRKRQTVLNV